MPSRIVISIFIILPSIIHTIHASHQLSTFFNRFPLVSTFFQTNHSINFKTTSRHLFKSVETCWSIFYCYKSNRHLVWNQYESYSIITSSWLMLIPSISKHQLFTSSNPLKLAGVSSIAINQTVTEFEIHRIYMVRQSWIGQF